MKKARFRGLLRFNQGITLCLLHLDRHHIRVTFE